MYNTMVVRRKLISFMGRLFILFLRPESMDITLLFEAEALSRFIGVLSMIVDGCLYFQVVRKLFGSVCGCESQT